jgi:hypothetical protein
MNYAMELVAERASDWSVSRYVTDAMQRGIDLQEPALTAYEAHAGVLCGPERLLAHPTLEHFLSTPDATVGADGLVEVKVPSVTKYVRWRAEGKIPEEHIDQIIAQQAVARRKWTDFVAYCPEMPPPLHLFVVRYEVDLTHIEQADKDARWFLDLVETMFHQFVEGRAA